MDTTGWEEDEKTKKRDKVKSIVSTENQNMEEKTNAKQI